MKAKVQLQRVPTKSLKLIKSIIRAYCVLLHNFSFKRLILTDAVFSIYILVNSRLMLCIINKFLFVRVNMIYIDFIS